MTTVIPHPNASVATSAAPAGLAGYNFAYLDEQTKRMIRRALLKAVAIPGYQVPFGSREMPPALWLGHRRHPGDRRRHWP